jgi:excisionase family DNA binding protein
MAQGAQDQQEQRTDEWLSTREAAEYLGGITVPSVYRLVDDGLLPAYRPTRGLRFRRSDLDTYLEQARVRPGDLAHLRSDSVGRAAKAARHRKGRAKTT